LLQHFMKMWRRHKIQVSDAPWAYPSTTDALWVHSRGRKNPEGLPRLRHDTKNWDQQICPYGKGNGILWMVADWEPKCSGPRSRSSQWRTHGSELNMSITVWNCSPKWIPVLFHEVS
jgi:hypothetical protein